VAIVVHRHTLFLPLYLGLATWIKALLKKLTPKLLLFIAKNSALIRLRQTIVGASTQFFVLSHKPWRRRLATFRETVLGKASGLLRRYLESPLWIRSFIALVVLAVTASSSYVFIAVLIIPQAVLTWLRVQVVNVLNKLGVTQLFNAMGRFLVPASVRHRWHMYRKWTLGRRQVIASRRLHARVRQSIETRT